MNKERLQNYNEILSENNLSLEDINNTINELPDVSEMVEPFEINDASYLFYNGSRDNCEKQLVKLIKNPTSLSYMYYNSKLNEVDLSGVETSNVLSNMEHAFYGCQAEQINVSNLVTDNVKSLQAVFYNCIKAKKIIGLENWNTSNVTSMYNAICNNYVLEDFSFLDKWNFENVTTLQSCLYACRKILYSSFFKNKTFNKLTNVSSFLSSCIGLEEVDFSGFNAPLLTSASRLLGGCDKLKKANISNWNTPKLEYTDYLFYQTRALETIIIDGQTLFPMTSTTMFTGNSAVQKGTGFIYVPDNMVDTYKSATNWSTYADQIKPLSELPEDYE